MAKKKSELDKWSDIHEDWVAIIGFLEYLDGKRIMLCQLGDNDYTRIPLSHYDVKRYFYALNEIDPMKLEMERRALLDEARKGSKKQ